jgi:Zn-dependent protease with chaperone function
MVNAVAMPLSGAIAFSRVALEVLDDQQLAAVCIHELAHLAEPRRVQALRVVNSMMMLGYVEALLLARGYGIQPVIIALAAFLIGKIVLARLSRSWESRADQAAVTGQSEQRVYAGALMQLHASNLQPLVMTGGGGTHPHAYDRIVAAGLQPEFPRPAPPSRVRMMAGLLIVLLTGVFTNAVIFFAAAVATGFARAIRSHH